MLVIHLAVSWLFALFHRVQFWDPCCSYSILMMCLIWLLDCLSVYAFADDTQLHQHCKLIRAASVISAACRICQWIVSHRLKLNPSKKVLIAFVWQSAVTGTPELYNSSIWWNSSSWCDCRMCINWQSHNPCLPERRREQYPQARGCISKLVIRFMERSICPIAVIRFL